MGVIQRINQQATVYSEDKINKYRYKRRDISEFIHLFHHFHSRYKK